MEDTRDWVTTRLRQSELSTSLDKEDLLRLSRLLQDRGWDAEKLEQRILEEGHSSEEDKAEARKLLGEGFTLRVSVLGSNGRDLYGTIDQVFGSSNFPEEVSRYSVVSNVFLRVSHNYFPSNSFEITLDFGRPRVFDLRLLPSQPTPNPSYLLVDGHDPGWANGLFHEISEFVSNRKPPLTLIHRHSVYDVCLWFVGYPIAFFVCYRLGSWIESFESSAGGVWVAAAYLYTFLIVIFIFRIVFHYARWVFPAVEFKHKASRAIRHRVFLSGIILSILAAVVYDIIRASLRTAV